MSGPVRDGRAAENRSGPIVVLVVAFASMAPACRGPAEPGPDRRLASEPRSGGVLRMVQEAPRSLDPADVDSVYESLPVNQLFDGLVDLDASLGVVPALAGTWTVSRDGRRYEFHLGRGVRFHDGTPLTAADVEFTIRRLLRPDGGPGLVAPYLEAIVGADRFAAGGADRLEGVVADGDHTVRIDLDHPFPSFLELLATEGLRVVPRHVVERIGVAAFRRSPVGTGPFRLARWNGAGLRLEANPDYFRGRPYLDAIDIRFLGPDPSDTPSRRFFGGAVDVLEPAIEDLPRLREDDGVRLYRYQELSLAFLGLCTRRPPLDRIEIRQAIAHAIDRRGLLEERPVLRRDAVGILPPGLPGYSPVPKTLPFDPERARALLRAAGYSAERPLPAIPLLVASKSAATIETVDRIATDLAAVGIRMDVRHVTWQELSREVESQTAPAFILVWVADMVSPDMFLRSRFEAGGKGNYFGFHDADTERLLRAGFLEIDPLERVGIYRRLERHILGQAPVVPLYHDVGVVAVRDHVNGMQPTPMGLASVALERVWLRSSEEAS